MYVVVPAGSGVLLVPVPKFSVKIGSPEFPLQSCACVLYVKKHAKINPK